MTEKLTKLPTLGQTRECYDNTAPEQLEGLDPELRSTLMTYTYASKTYEGVRYVRADRFLRAGIPTPGLSGMTPLTREVAHELADQFVTFAYGPGAARINTHSLDVSPANVLVTVHCTVLSSTPVTE